MNCNIPLLHCSRTIFLIKSSGKFMSFFIVIRIFPYFTRLLHIYGIYGIYEGGWDFNLFFQSCQQQILSNFKIFYNSITGSIICNFLFISKLNFYYLRQKLSIKFIWSLLISFKFGYSGKNLGIVFVIILKNWAWQKLIYGLYNHTADK